MSPETIDLLVQALDNVQITVTGAEIAATAAVVERARRELETARTGHGAPGTEHVHTPGSGRIADTNPSFSWYPDCPACFPAHGGAPTHFDLLDATAP